MKPALLAAIVFAVLAETAVADEVPSEQQRRATIIGVFEKNGCTLTEAQADSLFNDAGLDQARDSAILMGMIADGTVQLSPDRATARLITGDTCEKMATEADAETKAVRGRIIAAFESAGCVMTQQAFMQKFEPEAGTAFPMVEAMFNAGELRHGESGAGILMIGEKCTARLDAQKTILVAALEQNGCRLTEAEAREALSDDNVSMTEAEAIAQTMIADGEAALQESVTGEELVLKVGSVCG